MNILPSFLKDKVEKFLKRRRFQTIDAAKITHFPNLELRRELSRNLFSADPEKAYFKMCTNFDKRVASSVQKYTHKSLIGYEMACEKTFSTIKKHNGQCILDLSQIHYNWIKKIAGSFPGFQYLLDDSSFLKMVNDRKERELQLSDHILCLSSFAAESLYEEGYSTDRISIVNLGFSQELFDPKQDYSPKKAFQLIFVGTLTNRKGIDVLINVFSRLKLKYKDVELTLVGPMGDAKKLISQTTGIHIVPFTNQEGLKKLYQEADLFVFPSYLDSWAMVVIEAMACGTPVIITDNTGSKDAVVKGGGKILETGNEEQLYETILEYYTNRDLIELDGKRAVQVASEYTWENYYAQINTFVKSVN